jgi:hypothetical protein
VLGAGQVRHERIVLFGSSLRAAELAAVSAPRPGGPAIRDTLLKALDRGAPDVDNNPSLSRALMSRANTLIALHVTPTSGGTQ